MVTPTKLDRTDWCVASDSITRTSIAAGAAKVVTLTFATAPDTKDLIIQPIIHPSTGNQNYNMATFLICESSTVYHVRLYNWGTAATGAFDVDVNVYSHNPTLSFTLSQNV